LQAAEPSATRLVESDGLPPWFTFPLLDETGKGVCAFSTRLGGVSPAPFDSLNLGTTTRDDPAHVRRNREAWGRAVGHPILEWVNLEHGNVVHAVEAFHASYAGSGELPVGDAIVTDRPALPLTIYTADCVPIAFLDPDRPAIGLAHAGWRGTVKDVAGATVRAMGERFGSDPARLLCGLGASIGPCCFEVHDDVAGPVCARFPSWQESVVSLINTQKYSIDLWELNRLQLERAGVLRRHIAMSRLCTACRGDLFFSYRRDRRETGRLAMLLALR
jgi:YfiH family protein